MPTFEVAAAVPAGNRRWHYYKVRPVRVWLLVAPLGLAGVLGGHEIAYAVTNTPPADLHAYASHVPQIAMLLGFLSLVGASLVERGRSIALWPFPAVVMVGFVAQEHIERIAHDGSVPLLIDKPFFLIGLVLQAIVAIAAWLLARLLVRVVGLDGVEPRPVAVVGEPAFPTGAGHRTRLLVGSGSPRAPPPGR